MSFLYWRSGRYLPVLLISMLAFLASCGPARYAYFQPQRNVIDRTAPTADIQVMMADTLPSTPTLTAMDKTASPAANVVTETVDAPKWPVQEKVSADPSTLHRNPDSYQNQRFNRLFKSMPVAHVAPQSRLIDRHSTTRKTHWLALVALGLAVAAYGPILLAGAEMAWVVSIILPLSAMLLGTASLASINRHKDRYRGKGWAMAAIVLATGALGMAVLAIAALSGSELVKK